MYRKASEQVTTLRLPHRDRKASSATSVVCRIQRVSTLRPAPRPDLQPPHPARTWPALEVDRRMLVEPAVNDINAFNALVKVAKDALPADINAPKA